MATSIIVEFLCGKENQRKTRLHFLYLFLCGNTQEDVIYNNITVTIIIIVISLYFVGKDFSTLHLGKYPCVLYDMF